MPKNNPTLIFFVLGIQSTSSSGGDLSGGENYERVLVQKLLSDYDTAVRPSRNISVPLNVTFGLALTQIIDVVRASHPYILQNNTFFD